MNEEARGRKDDTRKVKKEVKTMRKLNLIVAGLLSLALVVGPASAMNIKTLSYSESRESGAASVVDDDGYTWLIRFRDNVVVKNTPGVFDLGIDYVIGVFKFAKSLIR